MDQYTVLDEIGSGSFGKVYKIQRKADGRILVWKELNYGSMSDKEKQLLVSEVNILREFRHPHIVRYYDRIIDREHKKIYIVMEYCEGGDLAQLIKKNIQAKTKIDEELIWRFFMQLCLALKECHSPSTTSAAAADGAPRKILHRDIKPGNVLLDEYGNVKLSDFGLARILGKESRFATTNVGTPYYMSPEQTNELAYDEKCDIWSLGCVIYELCALCPPFQATNHVALAMKIRKGVYKPIPTTMYSQELISAINSMLNLDPSKRPTVDELLSLPHITFRLKERKLNQHYNMLKKKEEELMKREMALNEREKQLDAREKELKKREAMFSEENFNAINMYKRLLQRKAESLNSNNNNNNNTITTTATTAVVSTRAADDAESLTTTSPTTTTTTTTTITTNNHGNLSFGDEENPTNRSTSSTGSNSSNGSNNKSHHSSCSQEVETESGPLSPTTSTCAPPLGFITEFAARKPVRTDVNSINKKTSTTTSTTTKHQQQQQHQRIISTDQDKENNFCMMAMTSTKNNNNSNNNNNNNNAIMQKFKLPSYIPPQLQSCGIPATTTAAAKLATATATTAAAAAATTTTGAAHLILRRERSEPSLYTGGGGGGALEDVSNDAALIYAAAAAAAAAAKKMPTEW